MTTADQTLTGFGGPLGILDREHIIAKAAVNRVRAAMFSAAIRWTPIELD